MPKAKKKSPVKEKFPCPVCGITLSSSYNLKIHTETNCSTQKNFQCELCDSKFLTTHSLKNHLNSIHFGEKTFICEWCGKCFLSKGQLKVHERSHTKEKTFVCGVCNKGFSHRESLVTHSTVHTGVKPYICECCSNTFSCVGNLIKHRKVRPSTCGLPIYSNKKICRRAGVKCLGKSPKIIVDTVATVLPLKEVPTIVEKLENEPVEEVVYETHIIESTETFLPHTDHQYVSCISQSSQDVHLEDYTKKEMDVFDYIGIEIRNIEEREKELQMKSEETAQENVVEELTMTDENPHELFSLDLDSTDVQEEDETVEEEQESETMVVIERIYSANEDYDEEDDMKSYIEIVDGMRFHCKLCPKIYQKRNITMKHLKTEHGIVIENYNYDNMNRFRKPQKELNWKCRTCPKRYTSKRLAERHEKVHGPKGDLIFKCSCCVMYFPTSDERDVHQEMQHEDRLKCKIEECGKKFDHPEKLVSHVKYAHTIRDAPIRKYIFVCQICGRSFNTRVALSDHERSNCGKAPIYQCNYCDRNYHSAGSLKCHLTIHTNVLDFTCTFCDKKFRTKGQLTIHLRSHTKEKNFKCTHCPAEFSHRESLLTHNTLHTGIKRFECSSCGSRFSCISNLLAHKRSHKNTCGDSQINKVSDADNSVKLFKTESVSDT